MSYARLSESHDVDNPTMRPLFMQPEDPARTRPPKITPARRRKLLLSYLPDWIITLVLAALFFSLDKVDGFKRQFSVEDTSLRHTFAVHERIPNWGLYLIAIVAPFCLQPIVNLFTIRSWWDFHSGSLGLILGLALTGAVTQFAKITVGRPRPDVLDRCQPLPGSVDPIYGLSSAAICTQTDVAILRDGFRSFPSGHSSLSFAGLGFLAFYLAGKLHLFDERGHAGKAWLSLTPFAGAALVAISRTMDSRHHWQDVLVGSILGTVFSYFSYRQYYPSLTSATSHRPYSPRIKRERSDVLPLHHVHSGSQDHDSHGVPPVGRPTHTQAPQQPPLNRAYSDDPAETDRTVKRPDPGPLTEVWREGDSDNSVDDSTTPLGGGFSQRHDDGDSRIR